MRQNEFVFSDHVSDLDMLNKRYSENKTVKVNFLDFGKEISRV